MDSARPPSIIAKNSADDIPDTESRQRLLRALGLETAGLPLPIRAALEAMADEILALRQEQKALKDSLSDAENLADRDTLCPVFNRRAFERELKREIALAQRYATPLSLVFIDLDRFKLINDRFGHETGDRVIQHVANTLIQSIRQTDIVGRLGGDEFGIALPHAEFEDSLAKVAAIETKIDNLAIRDPAKPQLEPVKLGASCGVVEWQPGFDMKRFIALADETMFRVKARRKAAR